MFAPTRFAARPLVPLSLAALALVLSVPAFAEDAAPRFDPEAVRAHVTFLADDAMDGREAGTQGYDIAANYVASRFLAIGALPAGDNGTFFQRVPLREAKLEGTPVLTLTKGSTALRYDTPEKAIIGASLLEREQRVEAPLVFAGYGIDRADLGLADYRGLDVRGKIVVVLTGFPKGMNSELGAHLSAEKGVMAMNRGAIGVISIPTRQDTARRAWEVRVRSARDASVGWVGKDGQVFTRTPNLRTSAAINPVHAGVLFEGARQSLDAILTEADRAGARPRGFALAHRATIERTSTWADKVSNNVVATMPGSDPALANEVVVMTAHLDHLGDHSTARDGSADKVANGAMDNAAGVATMIEVAQALATSGTRPRRPILFAAVTAEEKGLIGSDYLARNPVTGEARSVGVVNFDMPILTYKFTDVIAFGAENSSMGPMVASAAAKAGITLSPDPMPEEGLFTRSDHYRFVQQGVPAVFLMTGFAGEGQAKFRDFLAKNYHQPSDDLKLPFDWQAGAKFAEVNYHIVRTIADAPVRPQWYEGNFFGKEFAPTAAKAVRVKP